MFSVESIEGSCTAVPYYTDQDCINAMAWLILKPKKDWYDIFTGVMKTNLKN